jgi:hypothetical protein
VAICASVSSVCTGCCAVCDSQAAQHPEHTLLYRLKHILPLHSNNFNDVFLLITSTKTVTLAWFCRMLHDDGPNGPKHVGAV